MKKQEATHESRLLELVRSTRDAEALEEKIEKLERALYRTKVSKSELEEIDFPKDLFAPLPHTRVSDDPEALRMSLQSLKTALRNLPAIQIEIGFEPDEETIELLVKWVRRNISEGLLLDLVSVPSYGAGLRISYQGTYWQYTLDDILAEIFKEKKEKILNVIRPVVTA